MSERKAREDRKGWQENMYLENRMLATNDRNDNIDRHVANINIHEIQSKPKGIAEAADQT
jgi:hypothetical protein